jgi:hypothetical protein
VITAELPTYRGGSANSASARSQYAQPRPPGRSRRRDPAPVPLRIVVWLLGFVCVLSLLALVTAGVHPSWLAFLRNTSVAAKPSTGTTPPRVVTSGKMTLASQTTTSATYDVPAAGFTILLQPLTVAFVTVTSPATSKHLIYASNVAQAKNGGPLGFVYVKKSAAVVIERASTVLELQQGTKLLGTINAPKTGFTYIFIPKG